AVGDQQPVTAAIGADVKVTSAVPNGTRPCYHHYVGISDGLGADDAGRGIHPGAVADQQTASTAALAHIKDILVGPARVGAGHRRPIVVAINVRANDSSKAIHQAAVANHQATAARV